MLRKSVAQGSCHETIQRYNSLRQLYQKMENIFNNNYVSIIPYHLNFSVKAWSMEDIAMITKHNKTVKTLTI